MPKYLCMQRNLPAPDMSEKPAGGSQQDMMAQFQAWMTKYQDQLVDTGGGLGPGSFATAYGNTASPSEGMVNGYMIVSADSLDEAVEIASACPGLVRPGSGVDVREIRTPGA